jgi:hypothetical protein
MKYMTYTQAFLLHICQYSHSSNTRNHRKTLRIIHNKIYHMEKAPVSPL